MTNSVQNNDRHSTSGIGTLIVQHPRQDVGNSGKDTSSSEEDTEVLGPDRVTRGKKDIADTTNNTHDNDSQAALLYPICNECGADGHQEGDEIRRRREALRIDGGEAHLLQDSRKEDGKRGEGNVA